jgi:phosphotransferase system enzyme I (PtsP)
MTGTGEAFGLRALEDINQLILESHDLQETLTNIVNLVARRMASNVCSIYLLDNDGETLRLKASRGLSRGSIGKVTMRTSEGLTGLVIETRGVVATDNAPAHPRFKYFKETGEERFLSFLGIPLMDRDRPMGVIVVQTREARTFSRQEITTLSTIAWQIASIIINATLLESISTKERERAWFEQELARLRTERTLPEEGGGRRDTAGRKSAILNGSAVSPGFAWGRICILNRFCPNDGFGFEEIRSVEEEQEKFARALEKARIQTLYLEKRIAESLSEDDASIFHSHLMILEDRGFIGKISALISREMGAARAVREVVDSYVEAFSRMADPYLRERSSDMKDIGRRLLEGMEDGPACATDLPEARIIVADEILPSELAILDHGKILGIATELGDTNSHAAIMARSLGVPAILGISGLLERLGLQDELILDGTSGRVYINPAGHIREEYQRLSHDFDTRRRELEGLRDLPAMTTDGVVVTIRANIGLMSDMGVALANGAAGAGLYRTEFPYMARRTFPDRNDQYHLYRKILEGFSGQIVTIRTLDIGGDKGLPYFPFPKEDNPFMGWRSIRVSLDRLDIFREQLAAILMAGIHGKARILLPMISSVEEIRAVKALVDEVSHELESGGVPCAPHVPIGIMIELPAAVQTARILLQEADFASIGSNDLIQYTLAADRNNPLVKQYYNPLHPSVLHSIRQVAKAAEETRKPVSLCGEMATDPMTAILLVGMGICELSLSAPAIPKVKQAIRSVSFTEAKAIAAEALSLISPLQTRSLLEGERHRLRLEG